MIDKTTELEYSKAETCSSLQSAPPKGGVINDAALYKTLADMAGLQSILELWSDKNGVPIEVLAEILTREDTLEKLRNLARARVIANIGNVLGAAEEYAMMPNNSADRKLLLGIAGFTTNNVKVETDVQPITMVEIRMDEGLRKYNTEEEDNNNADD